MKNTLMITGLVILVAAALIFGLIPGLGLSARDQDLGFGASGKALVGMADDPGGDSFLLSTAAIQVSASDIHEDGGSGADHLVIDADISAGWKEYRLRVRRAMPSDPLGRFDAGGGVRLGIGLDQLADGSSWFPSGQTASFAAFGYGDVTCHGDLVGMGLPVRLFTIDAADTGFPLGAHLVLDIGDESLGLVQDQEDTRQGRLRVLWPGYQDGFTPIPVADETGVCS